MKCSYSNYVYEVKESGWMFSCCLSVDVKHELIFVERKEYFFIKTYTVHRFDEVEEIVTDYGEFNLSEDRDVSSMYLYIKAKDRSVIWSSVFIQSELKFRDIIQTLQNIFAPYIHKKNEHQKQCPECNRLISKVSRHCIYCGCRKVSDN